MCDKGGAHVAPKSSLLGIGGMVIVGLATAAILKGLAVSGGKVLVVACCGPSKYPGPVPVPSIVRALEKGVRS